jgi:DnaJ-class molecular chaperone
MKPSSQNSQNQVRVLKIRLEDVVNGNPNLIYHHTRKVLRADSNPQKCSLCKGQGSRAMQTQMAFMQVMQQVECPQCQGKCFSNLDSCYDSVQEKLKLNIPKDCQEGDRIILKKKLDDHPVHPVGDLVLQIQFQEHPLYKRIEGSCHLYTVLTITLYESLFGFQRTLTYLNGQKLTVAVEKSMHGDAILIPFLPQKGLYDKRTHSRQHLFLVVKCVTEPELMDEHGRLIPNKFIPYLLENYNKQQGMSSKHEKTVEQVQYQTIGTNALFRALSQDHHPSSGMHNGQHQAQGQHHPQCAQQ